METGPYLPRVTPVAGGKRKLVQERLEFVWLPLMVLMLAVQLRLWHATYGCSDAMFGLAANDTSNEAEACRSDDRGTTYRLSILEALIFDTASSLLHQPKPNPTQLVLCRRCTRADAPSVDLGESLTLGSGCSMSRV
ncbi:hypothetical protein CSOJ01_01299 [Colletotrichum sojae]|uniref:Uncharacterized protein n=1 Tax=Colletotrichum sojae TaxID=2175907 RepID=A0A8H6N4U0_9PEZI|nr:hypothetical protein CSOJ01_01299 [Colletotrichum sojae]